MSEPDSDLDSLTVLFAGLELTIRRRPGVTRAASVADFELVEPSTASPPRSTRDDIFAAYTADQLSSLRIPELDSLARRLTGTGSGWTGFARVARAYRAGLGARLHLSGGVQVNSPPITGLRNTYFIVLRSPACEEGFWTRSSRTYAAAVAERGPQRRSFDPLCTGHSFASQAEAEAYLLGAERQWPPHRE